jgi:NRPS condensation-like uncharacterized protein
LNIDTRQFLNAADRLMLTAHHGLRSLGHTGFQCQTHAWLEGCLDVSAVRAALARLAAAYPVVTSRLAPRDRKNGPSWQFDRARQVEFTEYHLPGADPRDVLNWAEGIFETPLNLDQSSPIGFHLLHLPDGSDVIVIRFVHALMDGKSPELVLNQINRLYAAPDDPSDVAHANQPDEIRAYLERFEKRRRRAAAWSVIRSHIQLPRRAIRVARPDAPRWVVGPYRVKIRTLDADQSAQIAARVKKLCGFPNLAAAMLASAFRGIIRHSPRPVRPCDVLQTDVPINLRPPGAMEPVFHNFMSFAGVRMRAAQLADRDAATLEITAQMRRQIRAGADLGNLEMMHFMSRFDRALRLFIRTSLQKAPFSLAFGFQGPAIAGLENFCGLPVSRLYSLISALHPPGVTLQINQFRGSTNLVLTHVAGALPDDLAESYLDTVTKDLLA